MAVYNWNWNKHFSGAYNIYWVIDQAEVKRVIDQAVVKFLFAWLWTNAESRAKNKQQKSEANIQQS